MAEAFFGIEFILLTALLFIWGLTGFAANNIKYAIRRNGRADVWIRPTRIGVWLGKTVLLLWLAVIVLILFVFGWLYVIDRFVVVAPLLALPALSVMALSVPKLKKGGAVVPESLLPILVPIQTMAMGAGLALYLVAIDIPAIPDAKESASYLAVLLGCAGLLRLYHKRRVAILRVRQPGFVARSLRAAAWAAVLFAVVSGWCVWSLNASRLPETMHMVNGRSVDFGGGPEFAVAPMHHGGGHHQPASANATVSVTDLTGPKTGEPDKRFTLYAEKKTVALASGKTVEAWAFNGQVPGPQLVVNEGDLVEVELVNRDIEQGVTIHWHGVDVPNAEDGVAGMTQDAVMPGETHTYRFVVEETGSHWYHSHQVSSVQVKKGLFGSFLILPEHEKPKERSLDMTVFAHDWETAEGTVTAFGLSDTFQGKAVQPGTNVRLRLMNSGSDTKTFSLNGTSFRVAAIDGNDIHEPDELTGQLLKIGGGGRYDVTFTMPETPVTLALANGGSEPGIVFGKDGLGPADVLHEGPVFDPTEYGTPAPSPFGTSSAFDRKFTMILDQTYFGFHNGKPGQLWTINGEVFPNVPTFMVRKGDVVKTTIVNRSFADHPIHLHGHHVHVLSKNGKPLGGSPLVLDTLLVQPGETYEVAFRADNPGLWMDHCHNLEHAVVGMSMHLAYQNVATPFTIGGEPGNRPE
jgi:FtsP/CotA-like multicopper oxidase with cupredoxin domain